MKKSILIIAALFCSLSGFAQTGGVKATVIDRQSRTPVASVDLTVSAGQSVAGQYKSSSDGSFLIEGLENGNYALSVNADGYLPALIHFKVERGFVRDLVTITLTPSAQVKEIDAGNFVDLDLEDSGGADTPVLLYSNDVYTSVAGYGFSPIRFKNRGYNSETQDVYLAGVRLNDALTGYSPFSLWSGLNDATRSKETTMGMETSDYGVGGYNGITNIVGEASAVRPGWRFSLLTNSAYYRLRAMASYSSGVLDNGWSYAFNVSARIGGNDWVEGVYYRSFAYYAGVDKVFPNNSKLSFFTLAAPGERGAQNASTQEVYDLMGDNMYNSNWGYQNGKVRNSRVRKTFEPVTVMKYSHDLSDNFGYFATLLWRTGRNGYTAIDWYDAMDPRPDYYRNLPSYFYMEDEDYNRINQDKYRQAMEMWSQHIPEYSNYQHLNWDRLYNVNYNNPDGRSKYALEERRVDQNELDFASALTWNADRALKVSAGVNARYNRTENYKIINDLLGGKYYLNIDQFAERDFAFSEAMIQNDLDYWLANGEAEKIRRGGKYGYDYYANIRNLGAWVNLNAKGGNFTFVESIAVGYQSVWRDGLTRKGLFAGSAPDGSDIIVDGINLTENSHGQSSLGRSGKVDSRTISVKLRPSYVLGGGHRVFANVGFFSDAPTFNQSFVSPRTRNTLVAGLKNRETISMDLDYVYGNEVFDVRVTGFWTEIGDMSKVTSFYDDSQQSFTNFAMTGMGERHLGLEIGAKVAMPFLEGLSLSGVLSLGEYTYTTNPYMTQTVDNSAEIVREGVLPYWKSHPVFRSYVDDYGATIYEKDIYGNYVVDHEQKHYVPSTPQTAAALVLNYRTRSYWYFEMNGQYFADSYLDMNPIYRTEAAMKGSSKDPSIIEYMASQERFDPVFLLNFSVGKSWYIKRKYNLGVSLEAKNVLNNTAVKTGGYEQARLISSYGKDRYYRFDPKYFYMCGANYMLNLYFRF